MLEELGAEEAGLRKAQDRPEGVLKIIAPVWFGSLDIGGIIGDFVALNPRVKINLVLGGFGTRQFRFLDEGFDLSIHTRELPVSTLVARRLGFISWKLCASPSYLSRTKELESLDGLQQHACLVHTRDNPWRFRSGSRTIVVKTNPLGDIQQLSAAATGGDPGARDFHAAVRHGGRGHPRTPLGAGARPLSFAGAAAAGGLLARRSATRQDRCLHQASGEELSIDAAVTDRSLNRVIEK
jgi:DNA-binding transcriptional LysR family regulator